jgi:Icc-related predicted phosphoesterase
MNLKIVTRTCTITVIAVILCVLNVTAETDFWFVQITDTHWGKDDNIQRTRKIVSEINRLPIKPAFVVHTGDILDKSAISRAAMDTGLAILKALKCPVYYAPGNNDIPKDKFQFASEQFIRTFGCLSSYVNTPQVSVITLFDFFAEDSTGKQVYDPIHILDSLLKLTPTDIPILVFLHFPITDDLFDGVFHSTWPKDKKDKFIAVCESHKVAGIICGHYHRDELNHLGSIPEFIAPPVAAKLGRQATFRIYHYENGKISYFTQYIE